VTVWGMLHPLSPSGLKVKSLVVTNDTELSSVFCPIRTMPQGPATRSLSSST